MCFFFFRISRIPFSPLFCPLVHSAVHSFGVSRMRSNSCICFGKLQTLSKGCGLEALRKSLLFYNFFSPDSKTQPKQQAPPSDDSDSLWLPPPPADMSCSTLSMAAPSSGRYRNLTEELCCISRSPSTTQLMPSLSRIRPTDLHDMIARWTAKCRRCRDRKIRKTFGVKCRRTPAFLRRISTLWRPLRSFLHCRPQIQLTMPRTARMAAVGCWL